MTAITAPVVLAQQQATDRQDPRIATALEQLRGTTSGREIATYLAEGNVPIRVLDDETFRQRYPGAGGVYDPKRHQISLPEALLGSSVLVTTLAHEGHHAKDLSERPHWFLQSMGWLGGSALDGVRAVARLDNPITGTLDSLNARQNEFEVTAYHLQAQVANELGRVERWSLGQADDGTPLPIEQVRENVANEPLYRLDNPRRAVLGGAVGLVGTMGIGMGVTAVLQKVAPASFLARNTWPTYAVAGAVMGALVLGDQLEAARRRGDRD